MTFLRQTGSSAFAAENVYSVYGNAFDALGVTPPMHVLYQLIDKSSHVS